MQANCIDIIVTSPPYNIGIGYNSYADSLPRDSYLAWLRNVAVEIRRVMKPSGSFFLNIGSTNIDPWLPWDVAQAFRDLFVLQNHIVWVKSLSIGDDTVGHFKPISSRRFINQNNESIFHFTSTGHVEVDRLAVGVPFKDKTNIARWGHKMDRRCAGNVWFIPYKTVRSKAQKFDHPAGFPVELPERCIKLHGIQQEALVLDPFMGAGSTLVAAERLGLRGIGIEIDKTYLEAALVRLSENVDANRAACCV
jgi:site-specific DNA-methyltransferase (adenine-specific)